MDEKEIEEIAKELITKFGFSYMLTMHILRYCKENEVTVHELIQGFKDNSIDIKYASYVSFGGYDSFKRLIIACLKEE